MKLFGLYLTPLYFAIATVESKLGANATNAYQLDDIYIRDVNRIMQNSERRLFPPFRLSDRLSRTKAECMMLVYWLHWGIHYERKAHKPVDYETLARIHDGGSLGWKRPQTLPYWNRVKQVLVNMDINEAERWMDDKNPSHYNTVFFPHTTHTK